MLDLEHDALTHRRPARESFLEGGVEFFDGETGEEAETAHVDRENGDAARGGYARGCKQRAVAAQDDEDLSLVGEFLAGECFGRVGKRRGGLFVVDDAEAASLQPLKELRNDGGKIQSARAGDDPDGFEDGSRLHIGLRFYFRSPCARGENTLDCLPRRSGGLGRP